MALLSAAGKNLKLSPVRRKDTGRRRRFALRGRLRGSGPAALGSGHDETMVLGAVLGILLSETRTDANTCRGLP